MAAPRSPLHDTLPDARPLRGPRNDEPTEPQRLEATRRTSGIRAKQGRRAVLEVDAASHSRDPRREK